MDIVLAVGFAKIGLSALILAALLFIMAAAFHLIYNALPGNCDTVAMWARNVFFVLCCLAGIIALTMFFIAAIIYGVSIL